MRFRFPRIVLALSAAALGCSQPEGRVGSENFTAYGNPSEVRPETVKHPAELSAESQISFAGASAWMTTLTSYERDDQVHDWTEGRRAPDHLAATGRSRKDLAPQVELEPTTFPGPRLWLWFDDNACETSQVGSELGLSRRHAADREHVGDDIDVLFVGQ